MPSALEFQAHSFTQPLVISIIVSKITFTQPVQIQQMICPTPAWFIPCHPAKLSLQEDYILSSLQETILQFLLSSFINLSFLLTT